MPDNSCSQRLLMGRIQLNTRLPLFHPHRLYFRLLIIPWFPWHLPLCSCHFSKLSCSACVLLGFTTLPTCIYLHLCRDLHACEAIKIKGSLTGEQSAGCSVSPMVRILLQITPRDGDGGKTKAERSPCGDTNPSCSSQLLLFRRIPFPGRNPCKLR